MTGIPKANVLPLPCNQKKTVTNIDNKRNPTIGKLQETFLNTTNTFRVNKSTGKSI